MNNKILRYCLLLLLIIPHFIGAQQPVSFTLKQAAEYGVSNHLSIQKSDFELEKYNQKFREELSGYLPQVNADAASLSI